jgi:photosystem II stability/assembly factor-like uncharacterized protein
MFKRIVCLAFSLVATALATASFAYDWIIYPHDLTTENLNSMGDLFAVGDNGVVLGSDYYLSGGFIGWYWRDSPTSENLYGVSTYVDLFIVGDSGVIFWDDAGTWESIESHTTERLNSALSLISIDGVYGCIVGDNGTILYLADVNPPLWELYPDSPTTQNLYSVSGYYDDFNITWAVGAGGTILDYEDGVWTLYPSSPTSEDLFSVYVPDTYYEHPYAWACGANGTILRWDASGWSKINNIPTTDNLYCIWGFADNPPYSGEAIFCVGAGGTILASEDLGLTWHTEECPVTIDLHGLGGFMGYVWAVGDEGTILSHGSWEGAIQPQSLGRVKALYYGSDSMSQKQPTSKKLPPSR